MHALPPPPAALPEPPVMLEPPTVLIRSTARYHSATGLFLGFLKGPGDGVIEVKEVALVIPIMLAGVSS